MIYRGRILLYRRRGKRVQLVTYVGLLARDLNKIVLVAGILTVLIILYYIIYYCEIIRDYKLKIILLLFKALTKVYTECLTRLFKKYNRSELC